MSNPPPSGSGETPPQQPGYLPPPPSSGTGWASPPPPGGAYPPGPGYPPPGGQSWGTVPPGQEQPYGYQYPPGYGAPYGQTYGAPAMVPRPLDSFGRPLAEWWRRLLAYLLDSVIVGIPLAIIYVLLIRVTGAVSVNPDSGQLVQNNSFGVTSVIGDILGAVVSLGYFAVLNGGARGQTVGKIALHIAVRDINTGGAIGIGRALLRAFLMSIFWAACVIPGLLDALAPLWDPRRQAWHDLAARSVVIEVP